MYFKKNNFGFTLVELLIVIAVIVILVAIAIPKYMSLKGEANLAAAESFAGALASASEVNYSVCNSNSDTTGCIRNIKSCEDFEQLLGSEKLPPGLTLKNAGPFPSKSGDIAVCHVMYDNEHGIEFRGILP